MKSQSFLTSLRTKCCDPAGVGVGGSERGSFEASASESLKH